MECERLKAEMVPDIAGIWVPCPTRWTVRAEALQSLFNNYEVLQNVWIDSLDAATNTEMKARIQGVALQMKTFDYFHGVFLENLIFQHSDNVSRTVQKADMSAVVRQEVASMTVQTLKSIWSDANFMLFWTKATCMAEKLEVSKPYLPYHKKFPRWFDDDSRNTDFPAAPENHYRRICFGALAGVDHHMHHHQPGFRTYQNVQELLLNSANNVNRETEFEFVNHFYDTDLNVLLLKSQLAVLSTTFKARTVVIPTMS